VKLDALSLPNPVDVLVVGAGPAGATAARHAARAGARVLVVDKRKQLGVPVQCGEYYPSAVVDGEPIAASAIQAQAGRCEVYFDAGPEPISVARDNGILIDRCAFDRWLVLRAIQAGATVRVGATLRGLDDHTARIMTASGPVDVTFGRLVAADGAVSTTRSQLGAAAIDTVAGLQVEVAGPRRIEGVAYFFWRDFPSGYGWVFSKAATANVGVAGDAAQLQRFLDRLLVWLAAEQPLSVLRWVAGRIPRFAPDFMKSQGSVMFAGDAAGAIDEVTWGGLEPAVVTGRRAGQWAACTAPASHLADPCFERMLLSAAQRRAQWLAAGQLDLQSLATAWYSLQTSDRDI